MGQLYLLVTAILVPSVQPVTKVRMAATGSYTSLTTSSVNKACFIHNENLIISIPKLGKIQDSLLKQNAY